MNKHSLDLGKLLKVNNKDFKVFEKSIKDLLYKNMKSEFKTDKFSDIFEKVSSGKTLIVLCHSI